MKTTTHRLAYAAAVVITAVLSLVVFAQSEMVFEEDPLVGLTPLPPQSVPESGTFFIYTLGDDSPPYPINPWPWLSVYDFGSPDVFLVDDRPLRQQLQEEAEMDAALTTLEMEYGMSSTESEEPLPAPGEGGEGGEPMVSWSPAVYDSNTLYLTISGVSNQWAYVELWNTTAEGVYELLSTEAVSVPMSQWYSEGFVEGLDEVTPTMVPMRGVTNLFLRARNVALDSSGQGIPDWWLMYYFGTTDVDLWTDPDGDGWSTYEEFMLGSGPIVWNIPPPPRNVEARLDASGTQAVLTWASGGGQVSHYTIWDGYGLNQLAQVSAATFSYTNSIAFDQWDVWSGTPMGYYVTAHFSNGTSATGPFAPLARPALDFDAAVVRGPEGKLYLVATSPPENVFRFDLYWLYWDEVLEQFAIGTNSVYTTNMLDGVGAILISSNYVDQDFTIVAFDSNGGFRIGPVFQWPYVAEEGGTLLGFIDLRGHIKKNLRFLLRSATAAQPFAYGSFHAAQPESGYGRLPSSAEYEYYGFHVYSPNLGYSFIDEFGPVQENYLWRNFAHDREEFDENGSHLTGAGNFYNADEGILYRELSDPLYYNSGETNLLLSAANDTWLYYASSNLLRSRWLVGDFDPVSGISCSFDANTNLIFNSSTRNCFGLALNNLKVGPNSLVQSGSAVGTGLIFLNYESPILLTESYYFVSQTPYFRNIAPAWDYTGPPPPLPGAPTFSVTNTSPILITSVGQPITVSAWAKQKILNNLPSYKYAYLQQYFDQAYTIDANGMATTNVAGVLSPYGEFFPTMPGKAALITMPDIDAGERGTGVVHVISMNVDRNRDGVMDFRYGGPDQTSPAQPYRFWVNDDDDSGETGGADVPADPKKKQNGADNRVNGVRDLIDFFPIYLNIRSVLQAYPAGTLTCWLKQADDALNYVDTTFYVDSDLGPGNCRAYLIDTNVALLVGRTLPSPAATHPITSTRVMLSSAFVSAIRDQGKGILLVEATRPTTQPLFLEIWQGTNLLAQTSLDLSISPVEKMFRHKNLIRETFPSSASRGAPEDRLADSDVPNEPETNGKNFVFLHGYNVNPHQARGTFSEVFKRMFWSGSRARFYGVSWVGYDSQISIPHPFKQSVTPNYHTNVVHAFRTAPKLAQFLATLTNGPAVVAAHSLGNVVVLSALSDWYAFLDKYFMIDAAVAVEAIDGSAGASSNMIHSDWVNYTNRLWASEWFRLFPAIDYRNRLSWSGRLANLPITNIYNFYSSGEEVLRTHTGATPDFIGFLEEQIINTVWYGTPPSAFVWALQEKLKGRAPFNRVLGSTHGGWKFNTNYSSLTPAQAALLSTDQLTTNAFFDLGSSSFPGDLALQGPLGNVYAFENGNRILSDAIPALTLPAGANRVQRLAPDGEPDRNFDMNAEFKNGWPSSRTSAEEQKWWHGDYRAVAYTFTYPLFNEFVNRGNLK